MENDLMKKIKEILLFVILLVLLVGIASATETLQENNNYTCDETVSNDINTVSHNNEEIINYDESNMMDENPTKNINESKTHSIENNRYTNLKKDSQVEVHNYTELQDAVNNAGNAGVNTTILLLDGLYNSTGTITWNTNDIVLTIDGNGQTLVANDNILFNIDENSNMILKNITIKNAYPTGHYGGAIYNKGTLTINGSILENNTIIQEPETYVATYGAAIYSSGILTVINSTLNNNSASEGAAIYNDRGGTLTLIDSILNNNRGVRYGGAILNHAGSNLTVINSTFNNNKVDSIGGAIDNDGSAYIFNSIFHNNEAYNGGAITTYGFLSVTDSTFGSNRASNQGGAIEIYNIGEYTHVTNSNFTANFGKSGGAIYAYGYLNATGNRFINNMASFNETINLRGYTNGIFKDNIYENNDIYLSERTLRIKDDQNIFLYGEDVVLNCTIGVYFKDYYKDFDEGVNDVILYINDEKNRTVKYGEDIIISNLEQGTYTAYFTSCRLQSNNVTFKVIIDYETNVSNYTQLVEAIDSAKDGLYNIYTINLLPGDYNATQSISWQNSFTKKIIINGNGITINGGNINSRFMVMGDVLENNYHLTINNITITNFTSTESGAAIYNWGGTLIITDSTFEDNHSGGLGGAIFTLNYNYDYKIINSTFRRNTADIAGGALYTKGYLNSTGNRFIDNHSINETINLLTNTDGQFKDNIYENTDINLTEKTLRIKDDQNVFVYGENVVLNYSIQLANNHFYKDFSDGINDITLYINDERNRTVKYGENITLSNLERGTYTAYFTTSNQQSNNVTFKIITDLETNVSNYVELVEAIRNASSEQYNIYTINLLPGDYNATQNISWGNSATHKIIINGNGIILNGKNSYRFFGIYKEYNLTLENIIITNYTANTGGAISNSGNLTVINSTLKNNYATLGGAIYNSGTLTIINSTLKNNNARMEGGTIYNNGIMTIEESTLENNYAPNGGAIYSDTKTMYSIINSTFRRNNATQSGGAIYSKGFLNATGNTFTDNHAKNKETIDLYGFYNGDFRNNTYESTDINLTEISLSINNYKTLYEYPEDIVLNYSIQLANNNYYKDFKTGINDITLYINNERYITTKYENTTLSDLQPGKYNIYFTSCNRKSNTVSFRINGDVVCNVSNYTQLVQAVEDAITDEYDSYTINLLPGDYNATKSINWKDSSTKNMTINGNNNTLDGQDTYQFMTIMKNHNLTLNNITFTRYTAENGGVIFNNGTLTINNSTLENNSAYYDGGTIENNASLTVTNTIFKNNTVRYCGGAICNSYGIINITKCVFENNMAENCGGAIYSTTDASNTPYMNVSNSNFTNNTAGQNGGGALYFTGFLNATGNTFTNNHAGNMETIELMEYHNGITNNNTYNSTDINITATTLNIKDNQTNFNADEEIVLNYNITLKHSHYYNDFKTGIRGITLYINDQNNMTTGYENITLSDLKPGKYNVYYTILNKISNTVTFTIIGESEISTPETSYEYVEGVNTKIPLVIKDRSGLNGTINITIKDQDNNYRHISTYYNVADGYKISTNLIKDTIENMYDTLESSYTIRIVYCSEYTNPSSTEFTLNISKQRNTIITYDILNNTKGNVQIKIIVLDQINYTPIPDANIQITGDITQNTTSGVIRDNLLKPGNHTITIQYPETENYKSSNTTIIFNIAKNNINMTLQAETVQKGDKTTITINTNETLSDGKLEVFIEDNLIATITEFDSNTITISDIDTSNYLIGENTITAKYTDSQVYNDITVSAKLTLLKQDISLSASSINITRDVKTTNLTVTFNDTVTDGTINILLNNNIIGSYTINENTTTADVIIYNTNIPKSPSIITVQYTDSLLYNDATINTTITTNKAQTIMTIDPITLNANKTATLTARITTIDNTQINEGKIIFKINGKTLKDTNGKVIYVKISNGIATLEYDMPINLIGQNITLTATYSGSSNYNQESLSITTNITQDTYTSPTLIITPITDDIQLGSTITLKAKITLGDKAISTGKILFKIDGKTLKDTNGKVIYVDVESNGEVSLNYNTSNLKVGSHTIKAIFIAVNYDKISDNTTMTVVKA